MTSGLWSEALYRETVVVVLGFLFILSLGTFLCRSRSNKLMATWLSLKSWLLTAPLLLIIVGLPKPWPLVALVLTAIAGAKTFFQMVGMYHRTWFVILTYIFLVGLGYTTYRDYPGAFYNLLPMAFMGTCCLIPILRNSYKHMIQYIALSFMAFIFLGWSFMHLGRLLNFEKGLYMILYIYILTEFSGNVMLASSRWIGKNKLVSKITSRVTFEGFIISLLLTLLLAWGMRHLLPVRTAPFWIASGLIALIFGRVGEMTLAVVRRDLGIKDTGVFIIGRDDILARMDKLIFAAPIFYYVYVYLQRITQL